MVVIPDFVVGQRVKRIGEDRGLVTRGDIYTVASLVGTQSLTLTHSESACFDRNLFEAVGPPDPTRDPDLDR